MSIIENVHHNLNIILQQAEIILKLYPQYNAKLHRICGLKKVNKARGDYILYSLLKNSDRFISVTDKKELCLKPFLENNVTKNMVLTENVFDNILLPSVNDKDDMNIITKNAYNLVQDSMYNIVNCYTDFIYLNPSYAYNNKIANLLNINFPGDNANLSDNIIKLMVEQDI